MKALAASLALTATCLAPAASAKPRLFVLTDIGNEPDDQMSLVRLLLYSNEIEIEGIAATTSVWQRGKASPEIAAGVIDAYGLALPHLRENAQGWPQPETLRSRLSSGVARYGLAAIDPDHPSAGALALLAAAQKPGDEPLWVAVWGGAATLAEALTVGQRRLSPDAFTALVARLRVYAISDQDDAGPWLRREFPGLFYIVSPSSQDGGDYARATWTGISGDRYYRNGAGADFTPVSNAWLDANIRAKGPLGAAYPRYMFIMEGDTPAFLGLIPNGLNAPEQPGWGGWGGRYVLRQPAGETRPIWTQGGDSFFRVTSADTVGGVVSDQATIWRWRQAFQNDFAARMDWSVKPFAQANHPPVVSVRTFPGSDPIRIAAKVGQPITLDASPSRDPDGQRLSFAWSFYPEAGLAAETGLADLRIDHPAAARVRIVPTAVCRKPWLEGLAPCPPVGIAHVILAVTDHGKPALIRYRRIILEVRK
ncbi:MAG: nucleoside hydrolase-like domain-containing protein [Novosphingobium sp.]